MAKPINYLVHLLRSPEGTLASHVAPFAQALKEEGYKAVSTYQHISLVMAFSRWLESRGISAENLCERHCACYLRWRSCRVRLSKHDGATLQKLLRFLRACGVTTRPLTEPQPLSPVERCVTGFCAYLQDQRGLAPVTIVDYGMYVRRFLTARFGRGRVRLNSLRAHDIMRYVQRQAAHMSLEQARHLNTALRSFLRYTSYCGAIVPSLSSAVPSVAHWSLSSIPRAMPLSDLQKLLQQCDRHTGMGRRDYAILLLLARLGLRSGEIVRLELDDIDWQSGSVCVRGKGSAAQLPLPVEVGRAIAAYLRHGRPRCQSRSVFLRAIAPAQGLRGSPAIGSIIQHRLQRAGIDLPSRGTHQLRHTLATQMLRRGASLAEIGQVLRHRHPDTTQIYAKVDVDQLRTLAVPWPEGAP